MGTDLNYLSVHDRIIANATQASRKKYCGEYYESHHIVPKCMGGPDVARNKVLLTAREHYIIHRLLTKIYPKNGGIHIAFARICYRVNASVNQATLQRVRITSVVYKLAKEKHAEIMSSRKISEETRENMRVAAAKRCDAEWRKNKSEEMKGKFVGKDNHFYGKSHSEETKRAIGKQNKGKQLGKDNYFYGKSHSEETKQKISNVHKGKTISSLQRSKQKKAMSELRWFNNSVKSTRTTVCPDGYVPGRLPFNRRRKITE